MGMGGGTYLHSQMQLHDIIFWVTKTSCQCLPNHVLAGPPPVYKYSLLYTFLFSFLLPYKSQRCFNTPPQSPLRNLLIDIAVQTALDEIGKREDKKDGGKYKGSIYRWEEALQARDLVNTNNMRFLYKMGLIAYQNMGCLCHCNGKNALNI